MSVLLGAAACLHTAPESRPVRPGIEVLLDDSLHLVSGRRVGLLTNQTGVDRRGVPDLDRLREAGVQVTAIFAPEHGYSGALDQEGIGNAVDSATRIPIYSLYGAHREPTPEMLDGVQVLVVDLQDVGARPYDYISTVLLAMRAAAAGGVPVLVLDRPNPIGGTTVQGPVLDTAFGGFNGMLPVPLRHGMTMGEMARMGNAWLALGARLTVVPAEGWRRDEWYDHTGLPWVRPSPSMPDLESATHYPGTVLFEATNLSVGRGTPLAFQVVGAPWLDAAAIVDAVGVQPGVSLRDTVVRPDAPPDGKYPGMTLPAVRLRVTDRGSYDPVATAVTVLSVIAARYPDRLTVEPQRFAELAGDGGLWPAIRGGVGASALVRRWAPGLRRFRDLRAPFLLYR